MKKALIAGITNQDGAYLAEFLLGKGYEVHGIKSRTSQHNSDRIEQIYQRPQDESRRFILHHGDLTDSNGLTRIVQLIQPDEIYNMAALRHRTTSIEEPEYVANADALGTLRLLEAIRLLGLEKKTRFYQASTSELYGNGHEAPPRDAPAPFQPSSPAATAELYAYWITVSYRKVYGLYACNGILLNRESSIQGETFLNRKINRGLVRISLGLEECLYLGNLDAKRDWGNESDYVEAQWLMLQQDKPEDFVIAAGEQNSIRDFINAATRDLGVVLRWKGFGAHEVAVVARLTRPDTHFRLGQTIVQIDSQYAKPAEWERTLGDTRAAPGTLNWRQPTMKPLTALVAGNGAHGYLVSPA